MYLNKAFIVGNLTRDPELKSLPNGTKVVNVGLATNKSYKNKQGEKVDRSEFHNVVAYGNLAELCAQYLRKGQQALIEGEITTRTWEKEDGSKGYKTEILASAIQFGPKQGNSARSASEQPEKVIDADTNKEVAPKGKQKASVPVAGELEYPTEDINPDDIPF